MSKKWRLAAKSPRHGIHADCRRANARRHRYVRIRMSVSRRDPTLKPESARREGIARQWRTGRWPAPKEPSDVPDPGAVGVVGSCGCWSCKHGPWPIRARDLADRTTGDRPVRRDRDVERLPFPPIFTAPVAVIRNELVFGPPQPRHLSRSVSITAGDGRRRCT